MPSTIYADSSITCQVIQACYTGSGSQEVMDVIKDLWIPDDY